MVTATTQKEAIAVSGLSAKPIRDRYSQSLISTSKDVGFCIVLNDMLFNREIQISLCTFNHERRIR